MARQRKTSYRDSNVVEYPASTKRQSKFEGERRLPPVLPKNIEQQDLLDALRSTVPQIIAVGPAGSGKTFIIGTYAADALRNHETRKIVILRPPVPLGRTLGYLPGDAMDKAAPWASPILSAIRDRIGAGAYDTAIRNNQIELPLLETIRGHDYQDATVIVDEVQNLQLHELECITTRIADGSRLIMMGDPDQSDVKSSPLKILTTMVNDYDIPACVVRLRESVRSPLTRAWVSAWTQHKQGITQ